MSDKQEDKVAELVSKITEKDVESFKTLITTDLHVIVSLLSEIAPDVISPDVKGFNDGTEGSIRKFLGYCAVLGLPARYSIMDFEIGSPAYPKKMLGIIYIILHTLRNKFKISDIKEDMKEYFNGSSLPELERRYYPKLSSLDNGINESKICSANKIEKPKEKIEEETVSAQKEHKSVCLEQLKELEAVENAKSFLVKHFDPRGQPRSHVAWLRNIDAENVVFFYDGTIIKGKDHADADILVALKLLHWLLKYRHHEHSETPFSISLICLEAGLTEPYYVQIEGFLEVLPESVRSLISLVIVSYSSKTFADEIAEGPSSPGEWADELVKANRFGYVPVTIDPEDDKSYKRLKEHEMTQVLAHVFGGESPELCVYPFEVKNEGK